MKGFIVPKDKDKLRDWFQVDTFCSYYRSLRRGGVNHIEAFAQAILLTSDEVVDKLPEGVMRQWANFKDIQRAECVG